jgi:hypothetical protein
VQWLHGIRIDHLLPRLVAIVSSILAILRPPIAVSDFTGKLGITIPSDNRRGV